MYFPTASEQSDPYVRKYFNLGCGRCLFTEKLDIIRMKDACSVYTHKSQHSYTQLIFWSRNTCSCSFHSLPPFSGWQAQCQVSLSSHYIASIQCDHEISTFCRGIYGKDGSNGKTRKICLPWTFDRSLLVGFLDVVNFQLAIVWHREKMFLW